MQTLAVLARKGGVGKTTLCVHLAVLAQEEGQRVLLVDLDPQRSAAEWWAARESDTPAVVQAEPAQLVEVLKAARDEGYDLAIIDTPPSVAGDTAAVARLADLVVIPTRPAVLDLRAIRLTVDLVRTLKAPAVVLLNAVPASRGGSEAPITAEARRALEPCGLPVVPVVIGARAALAHALVDGRAVTELEPAGKAAGELRAVWRFLKGTMDGTEKRGVLDALQPAKNVPAKAPEAEPATEARSKTLTLRLSVPAWTAIKMLAFERGLTAQAVVLEGLNAVLVKNGKPPVV